MENALPYCCYGSYVVIGGYSVQQLLIDGQDTICQDGSYYSNDMSVLIRGGTVSQYTLPDSVTTIASAAFDRSSVQEVILTDNLVNIGVAVFENSSLRRITIPSSVSTMGEAVFSCCVHLESVVFEEGISITSIPMRTFNTCRNLTSIAIPNSVTHIGTEAFALCNRLDNITVPMSVTTIEENAFNTDGLRVHCQASVQPQGWVENWAGDASVLWNSTAPNNQFAFLVCQIIVILQLL